MIGPAAAHDARAVLASMLLAVLGVATVGVLSVIGLPLVLIGLVALRPLADLHRRRVEWLLGTPVPRPPKLMWVDAQLTRSLLAPTENSRLAIRVRELAESRADAVDAQAAELRRIERDLHDAELRDVVRGIHPPVLADRGLAAAAEALVLALPLPVDIEIALPARLPAPVESAACFAVAEALTDVIKHSGARAWLTMSHCGDRLSIVVGHHGAGGADSRNGTGLRGIQRRLAAFDGALTVTSPSAARPS